MANTTLKFHDLNEVEVLAEAVRETAPATTAAQLQTALAFEQDDTPLAASDPEVARSALAELFVRKGHDAALAVMDAFKAVRISELHRDDFADFVQACRAAD